MKTLKPSWVLDYVEPTPGFRRPAPLPEIECPQGSPEDTEELQPGQVVKFPDGLFRQVQEPEPVSEFWKGSDDS